MPNSRPTCYNWDDPEPVGSNFSDNTYNEVWGLAVNGHDMLSSAPLPAPTPSMTDPVQPFEAHFVAGNFRAVADPPTSDYHDYNGYLYAVCDEGRAPADHRPARAAGCSVEAVYNRPDYPPVTIFLDTATAKLYVYLRTAIRAVHTMRIFDIRALNPVPLGSHNNFGVSSVGHVHDALFGDGIAF